MFGLEVVNPGVLSLIQDLGRQGAAHLGLSVGGPADLHAFCWANKLLGNPANAAVIEVTIGQASFKALQDITIALTGADMQATIDGKPQQNWQRFELKQGQLLSLATAHDGLRAYVTIAGGIKAPLVFGSAATVCRNQLGGLATADNPYGLGNKLQQGDKLLLNKPYSNQLYSNLPPLPRRFVPQRYIPHYPTNITVSVIESYQCDSFSRNQKLRFYQGEYVVSPNSDRMAIRLSGPAITGAKSGIISEGIAAGSVQIPPDGQPIILLNDRQTLGGYPKLGCITRLDQARLAQARPGSTISFRRAKIEQASQQWCQFMQFFDL